MNRKRARTAVLLCGLGLLAASVLCAQTAATVSIAADQPGAVVSSNLFGIFFEEINSADDGVLSPAQPRVQTGD
jgi:alpha-N-arabinofuranosidase